LVETNLEGTTLANCSAYKVSTWKLILNDATIQRDINVSRWDEAIITVDDLEVAQYIYLLLDNRKVRNVIDTITTKVVLVLGRFTPQRMATLHAIRNELRNNEYLPVMFDFTGPKNQDVIATVQTVARLARFVVADVTDTRVLIRSYRRSCRR